MTAAASLRASSGVRLGISAERHPLRATAGAGLDDEHFLAGGVDPDAESGKITNPKDGALAVHGQAFKDPFGESNEMTGAGGTT